MLYEIGIPSLFLLMAYLAVTVFFCKVEEAPAVVRNLARAVRFRPVESGEKLVHFWDVTSRKS